MNMVCDLNDLSREIINQFPSIEASTLEFFINSCKASPEELVKHVEFTLEKPYGLNHILLRTASFGVSFAQIKPHHGTSFHYHTIRREFFFVKSGTLTLLKENSIDTLPAAATGSSTPFEKHSLKNMRKELLEVLEIFTPPLMNDKVRVHDVYDRKLGGVNYLE